MRDPLAPIPSPDHPGTASYWTRRSPPPPPDAGGRGQNSSEPTDSDPYDPTRLLAGAPADSTGIDRRVQPRTRAQRGDDGGDGGRVLAAQHRKLEAVVGLRTAKGWLLMRTLSVAPGGVLVRLIDLLDPDLDPGDRARGRTALTRLAPALGAPLRPDAGASTRELGGSPLATVGHCLLQNRILADLAQWANHRGGRRSSRVHDESALAVNIVVPIDGTAGERARLRDMPTVFGHLAPLTDPQPGVLAVALSPAARSQLEIAVASARRNPGTARRYARQGGSTTT